MYENRLCGMGEAIGNMSKKIQKKTVIGAETLD